MLRCGIVGLPNVGKSTLFNALTSTQKAQAANYPFCTIEPNIGIVNVPDQRLQKLSAIGKSRNIISAQIEFVDIAGLVRGASAGEGLGNKFLSHIREVDAILYVLRCFENSDITHVEGRINPCADAEIIQMELAFADIESLEKRIPALEKRVKKEKELEETLDLMRAILQALKHGNNLKNIKQQYSEKMINALQLLSTKPFIYVCNVSEDDLVNNLSSNAFVEEVRNMAAVKNIEVVTISAAIESEIANIEDEEERALFLRELKLPSSGLDRMIKVSYDILGLIVYFTVGEIETRAWTISCGMNAQQAAGKIHSDFEKNFIRAEVVAYQDYIGLDGEKSARDAGKLRVEGRDYIVQDGDVMHFLIGR